MIVIKKQLCRWLALVPAAVLVASSASASWQPLGQGAGIFPGISRNTGQPNGFTNAYPSLVQSGQKFIGTDLAHRIPPTIFFYHTDRSFSTAIMALQWNGTAWAEVDGSWTYPLGIDEGYSGFLTWPAQGAATYTSLWGSWTGTQATTANLHAFGVSLENSVWTPGGGSSDGSGITAGAPGDVRMTDTAIAPNGAVYVAYSRGTANNEDVYVRRFAAGVWAVFGTGDIDGGISASTGSDIHPCIEIYKNFPLVAWTNRSSATPRVYVKRFNGSVWAQISGSATPSFAEGTHAVVRNVDDDQFFLSYENHASSRVFVKQWDGFSWNDLGEPASAWGFDQVTTGDVPLNSYTVRSHDMAIDVSGNPVVVFRAPVTVDAQPEIHLFASRWDSESEVWTPVGDMETDDTGLSIESHAANTQGHIAPSISIGLDNRPIVAWSMRQTVTTEEILVRRNDVSLPQPDGATMDQAIARVLGYIESNAVLDDLADKNDDGAIASEDIRLIRNGG